MIKQYTKVLVNDLSGEVAFVDTQMSPFADGINPTEIIDSGNVIPVFIDGAEVPLVTYTVLDVEIVVDEIDRKFKSLNQKSLKAREILENITVTNGVATIAHAKVIKSEMINCSETMVKGRVMARTESLAAEMGTSQSLIHEQMRDLHDLPANANVTEELSFVELYDIEKSLEEVVQS